MVAKLGTLGTGRRRVDARRFSAGDNEPFGLPCSAFPRGAKLRDAG